MDPEKYGSIKLEGSFREFNPSVLGEVVLPSWKIDKWPGPSDRKRFTRTIDGVKYYLSVDPGDRTIYFVSDEPNPNVRIHRAEVTGFEVDKHDKSATFTDKAGSKYTISNDGLTHSIQDRSLGIRPEAYNSIRVNIPNTGSDQ